MVTKKKQALKTFMGPSQENLVSHVQSFDNQLYIPNSKKNIILVT